MIEDNRALTPVDILNKPYTRRLTPDESGGFVASVLEFPGCIAEGDTADEALTNLDAAAESWLEVALSHGQYIKDPIDFGGFNGKVALRMPRTLHRQVVELAEYEGCSLNQLLVMAVAHYVGGKQLIRDILPNHVVNIRNFNVAFVPHVPIKQVASTTDKPLFGLHMGQLTKYLSNEITYQGV